MEMLRRLAAGVTLGASILAPAAAVHAQAFGRSGSQFRVNSFTTSEQYESSVSSFASNDAFVVAWTSYAQDGDNGGVFARRYDHPGAPLASDERVNTTVAGQQHQPKVSATSDGFVVAWAVHDGSSYGISAQRFAANGTPVGGEIQVVPPGTTFQGSPAVVVGTTASTFLVVWQSRTAPGDDDIRGQLFVDGLGAAAFRVNTNTTANQNLPAASRDNLGNFVVVWDSEMTGGGSTNVQGQRYSAVGVPLGGEFRVNTTTGVVAGAPAVSASLAGFLVAWAADVDVSREVLAQRYTSSGAPAGGEFRVNAYTTGTQSEPAVAAQSGGFVVTWSSAGEYGTKSVFARRYDQNGAAKGSPFRVNASTTGNSAASSVTISNLSDFVVTWTAPTGADGSGLGIFGQRYCYSQEGDANADGVVNVSDGLYLINYLFAGGSAPLADCDANGDTHTDVADVFYVINYLFAAGPAPACVPPG
jgi:hypothetical protein